jgi:nucleoside diphosphate kinase
MLSGTYVEKIEEDDIYIVNGFYAGMRADYLKAGNTVHWMVVDWKRAKLSWKDFRNKVLGGTDPAKAAAGSLRAEILNRWQPLGLKAAPSMQHNSIHASAGPVEALRERFIWGVSPCRNAPLPPLILMSGGQVPS